MNKFMNVNEVAEYMDISVAMAYKIIQRFNNELKNMGYLTIAGKISRKFFEERIYGGM